MNCDLLSQFDEDLLFRVNKKISVAICKGIEAKRLYLGLKECRELQRIITQNSMETNVWTAIRNGEVVCCGLPVTMVCDDSHLEALCY